MVADSVVPTFMWDQYPQAKEYIRRIEDLIGVPANIVSVGPDRAETLMLTNPFGEK